MERDIELMELNPQTRSRLAVLDQAQAGHNARSILGFILTLTVGLVALLIAILAISRNTGSFDMFGDVLGQTTNNHLRTINSIVERCGTNETILNGTFLTDGRVLGGFCGPVSNGTLPIVNNGTLTCPSGFDLVITTVTDRGLAILPFCRSANLSGFCNGPPGNNTGEVVTTGVVCQNNETLFGPTVDINGRTIPGHCGPPLPDINNGTTTCPPGFWALSPTVTGEGIEVGPQCVFVITNSTPINSTLFIFATPNQTTITDLGPGSELIGTAQDINWTSTPAFWGLFVGADGQRSKLNPKYYDVGLTLAGLLPVGNVTGNDTGFVVSAVLAARIASINDFDRMQFIIVAEGDYRWLYDAQWDGQFISTSATVPAVVESFRNGHWRLDGFSAVGVNVSAGSEVPWTDFSVTSGSFFIPGDFRALAGQLNVYSDPSATDPSIQTWINGATANEWISFGMHCIPFAGCFSSAPNDNFKFYHFGDSMFLQRVNATAAGTPISGSFQNVVEWGIFGARMYPVQSVAPLISDVIISEGNAALAFDSYWDPPTASYFSSSGNFNPWLVTKSNSTLAIQFGTLTPLFNTFTPVSAGTFFLANLNAFVPEEPTFRLDGDFIITSGSLNSLPNMTMDLQTTTAIYQLTARLLFILDYIEVNFGAMYRADINQYVTTTGTTLGSGATQIGAYANLGMLTFNNFPGAAIGTTISPPTHTMVVDSAGLRIALTPFGSPLGGRIGLQTLDVANNYLLFGATLDTTQSPFPIVSSNGANNPWAMFNTGNELQFIFADLTAASANVTSFRPAIRMYPTQLKATDPVTPNVRLDSDLLIYCPDDKESANITLYPSRISFVPLTQIISVSGLERTEINMGAYYRRDVGDYLSTTLGQGGQFAYLPQLGKFAFSFFTPAPINQTAQPILTLMTMDATIGMRIFIPLETFSGGTGSAATLFGDKVIVSQLSPNAMVESPYGVNDFARITTYNTTATVVFLSSPMSVFMKWEKVGRQVVLTITSGTAGFSPTADWLITPDVGIPAAFIPLAQSNNPVYLPRGAGATDPYFQWNARMDLTCALTFTISQAISIISNTVVFADSGPIAPTAPVGVCVGCAKTIYLTYLTDSL